MIPAATYELVVLIDKQLLVHFADYFQQRLVLQSPIHLSEESLWLMVSVQVIFQTKKTCNKPSVFAQNKSFSLSTEKKRL